MKVEKAIHIQKPLQEVFAFITNIQNISRWMPIKSQKSGESGPSRVGAKYVHVAEMYGMQVDLQTEVTELVPNQVFALKGQAGPVPLSSRFVFHELPTGTRVELEAEAKPTGMMRFIPGLNDTIEKQVVEQLEKLRVAVEG